VGVVFMDGVRQSIASSTSLKFVRWVARVWAGMMFLMWAVFFLSHLGWFSRPGGRPPGLVWWLMGLHLTMLIGLATGWRWELPGAAVVLISAPLFFFGSSSPNALAYVILTIIPALLWLICGLLQRRGLTGSPPF